MRKLTIIVVTIIFLSGLVSAKGIFIEVKGDYFSPSEKAFEDIYSGGIMVGAEASLGIWKHIETWVGLEYFTRKGELSFTRERTRLKIIPIGAGVKYSHPINEKINLYGGLGVNYYSYSEKNTIGKVSEYGLGPVIKAGGLVKVIRGFIVDVHIDYSYCEMKPADFKINIGGVAAGIGMGYQF